MISSLVIAISIIYLSFAIATLTAIGSAIARAARDEPALEPIDAYDVTALGLIAAAALLAAALWPLAWGTVLVWDRRERRAGGAARA